MGLPQHVLSTTPIPAPFLPPRGTPRALPREGLTDFHFGGVALSDPSQGITFQLWTAQLKSDGFVWLSAPNTPEFAYLNVGTDVTWVTLAFDQNARPFIAYSVFDTGVSKYYWFDTVPQQFVTSTLPVGSTRVFASLDDNRSIEVQNNDIIFAYVRAAKLYYREQRDRYGVEYLLGDAPSPTALLSQIGMNYNWRFQFGFQNVQGNSILPPVEWKGGI